MKSNSTIYPEKFFKSNEIIYIVDLSTVIETEIVQEHEGEEPTVTKSYTYEQYELPISDRDNLAEYIELNYEVLIGFGKEKERERSIIHLTENEKLWDTVNYLVNAEYGI